MSDPAHTASPLDRCAGLVFGFVFRDGRGSPVRDTDLPAALAEGHDWTWLHLSLADHHARRFLEGFEPLPAEARELMLGTEDRIRLHLTPGGGWGVLPDIERDFADQALGSGRVMFWADGDTLITARRHSVRVVDQVNDAVRAGLSFSGPAAALALHVEYFLGVVERRLAALSSELGGIEDAVLADHVTNQRVLGPIRRELSRYSREFSGLTRAIHRATSARRGDLGSPLASHLPQLLQDAEDFDRDAGALSDRARLLYEEIETRISSTTNRSLSALTVISTLMLPPTFIVGAFGMNLDGIPWSHDAKGFGFVVGLCVLMIGAGWYVLRRFRILP